MNRVVFDVIVIVSLLLFPWWVGSILAVIGLIYYKNFYEFLIVGSILYALYATPVTSKVLTSPLWFSIALSLTYLTIQLSRRYITYYKT